MSQTRKTAIVVGSAFGVRVHGRALRASGFEVVGLVGRDPEKTAHRARRADIPHAFTSMTEALGLGPLVVAIASPPATHFAIASEAFDAGAHVMCEKPFTLTQAEALELSRKAAGAGLVGYLGHEFRFTESAALVARLLAEGAIGAPRLATFVAHGGLVADPAFAMPDWWFNLELGGGWLGASGSHAVDRARAWLGEISGVSASLFNVAPRPAGSAEDSFDLRFTTDGGAQGVMQSTAADRAPPITTTKIIGERGTIWIEDRLGRGSVEGVDGAVMLADAQGVREIPVPDDLRLDQTGIDPEYARNVAPFAELYRRMAAAIEGAAPAPGATAPATFEDGVRNMAVLDAARTSAAAGSAWISIDSAANAG